ncbi:hypothetical protein [Candidatus Thiothrix anitrata]|uniref:Uncharacterized protein n=1 Tax=Candidatus Thiothrix anitrata TaxID=2823902 RepID=A0ABX7X6Z9_9GAMM|nr:hypothetical protein [Candidatus Thiothrix anitrata]QTR49005.1 hypothetical protein J8380_12055 [Candidatus Thiothrix anitrata]
MSPHHAVFGLLLVVATVAVFAGSDSQPITLTVPKVALVSIEPVIPFSFAEGTSNATGNSQLSISSNDVNTKLQITPTGLNLAVSADAIQCPETPHTATITCHVGINQTKNSVLAFNATPTSGDMNIVYTLTQ